MTKNRRKSRLFVGKYFLKKSLDTPNTRAYSPHPVAVLKGAVTGEGIGKRRGNAELEDSNRRSKLLPVTPQPKPKGLRRTGRQIRPGLADKNAKALAKNDQLRGSERRSTSVEPRCPERRLEVEEKPPEQKPNGTASLRGRARDLRK
ncbi:MAG TPA: hypothetical protein VFA21_07865 [Pyrinomonadaceae bacterium]|nr:hypothetical protein [Pyrinomonadaceae bacterium]